MYNESIKQKYNRKREKRLLVEDSFCCQEIGPPECVSDSSFTGYPSGQLRIVSSFLGSNQQLWRLPVLILWIAGE